MNKVKINIKALPVSSRVAEQIRKFRTNRSRINSKNFETSSMGLSKIKVIQNLMHKQIVNVDGNWYLIYAENKSLVQDEKRFRTKKQWVVGRTGRVTVKSEKKV